MKKLISVAVATAVLAACNQQPKEQKPQQLKPTTAVEKQSYALGASYAMRLSKMSDSMEGVEINDALFLQGVKDGLSDNAQYTEQQLTQFIMDHQTTIQLAYKKKEEQTAGPERAKGEAFLADNKAKDGVITTESGLQYKVIKQGDGENFPKETDTVTVHYKGTLLDGTEFDNSYKRNEPTSFPLRNVIKGWTEGVQLMSKGAKYQFFIHPDLGYQNRNMGPIPAGATLIFEIELIDFTSPDLNVD